MINGIKKAIKKSNLYFKKQKNEKQKRGIVPNKRTSASDSIIEKSFNKHFFSKYIELNNTNQNKEVSV